MLGIDGVRVVAARDVDGEVELTVETTADRDWCRLCGVRAHSKGRPTVVVRDVTGFGRRARLVWRKRRWRCPESACPAGSWTAQHPAVRPRLSMTERARAHACRRVGAGGESVAAVATDVGVGWHTVMRAVIDHGRPLVDDPARTAAPTASMSAASRAATSRGRESRMMSAGRRRSMSSAVIKR